MTYILHSIDPPLEKNEGLPTKCIVLVFLEGVQVSSNVRSKVCFLFLASTLFDKTLYMISQLWSQVPGRGHQQRV